MNTLFHACALDDAAVLQSPLQGVRNGQETLQGRIAECLVCRIVQFDFVRWQVSILQEGDDVVSIALVRQNLPYPGRHLEICCLFGFHKYRVQNIEGGGFLLVVIKLVVNEDQQRVSQPIYFLPRGLERAGGLRLADAGHFHVNRKAGKVNAAGGTALVKLVAAFQVVAEFVFEKCADGFAVRHAIQIFFRGFGL